MPVVKQMDQLTLDQLCSFMTNEPNVQACFKRLMNAVLANDVIFREKGRRLEPNLMLPLVQHYRSFLRHAMQQSFVCGFVAFYVRRPNGIPVPFAMPLGSFTWSVDINNAHYKRRKLENGNCVCRYSIHVLHGPISASEIHIVNYRDPVVYQVTDNAVHSPLHNLLVKFKRLESTFHMLTECNQWNAEKHVAITETVDLKDQTTSGIQLLDEMRRYTLTGQHGHGPTGIMRMRSRDNQKLNTVNDATISWLQDQFAAKEGGKEAKFHCLPPNMNVQELTTIEAGRELQTLIDDFTTSVYSFFDVPRLSEIGGSNTTSSGEQMSRHQYLNVLSTCQFMEHVSRIAYCASFQIEYADVSVTLSPQTRLEVHSAADIKALVEAEMLTPADKQQIKRLFMGQNGNI
tara:strand:- start:54505 stop:55710 length:1206 start_codon:yes stop_codon:yes gene_type:complete